MREIINKTKDIIIFSDLQKLFLSYNVKIINKSIIDLYKFLISNNKNVVLPTFNLNFPEIKKTSFSSNDITTGYLNKFLIKKFKFIRSKKPMYNYAISGPDSKFISNLKQTTAWGEDSILGYLVKNNSYGLGINVDPKLFNWLIIHYCEENFKVPYRYYKIFKGRNVSLKKNVQEKMYVRDFKMNKIEDGRKINKILIEDKIIKKFKYKIFDIYILPFEKYYSIAKKQLKTNKFFLVKNEK